MSRHRSSLLAAILLTLAAACSGGTCPTIDCVPTLTVAFAQPVTVAYRLSVQISGGLGQTSLAANCPMADPNLGHTAGIASCDDNGFLVTGVDLGKGDNTFININASINNGTPLNANGNLVRILNSTDCALVCYEHTASLSN